MKTRLLLLSFAALSLLSCRKDEETTAAVEVNSVAIVNSGEDGKTRAEGILNGDTFTIEVSPLSDIMASVLEIIAPEGVSTTPADGAVVDFEANGGIQALVANRGTEVKNYTVKVTKAELTDELVLSSLSVSGVYSPEIAISHSESSITVSCSNISGTVARLSDFVLNPPTATVRESVPELKTDEAGEYYIEMDLADDAEKYIVIANGSETKKYTVKGIVSQAGFNPETATMVLDQALGSNLNPELGTSNTRGAFFDGKHVFFASREGGNNVWYYDIDDATKELKSLDMGEGVIDTASDWAVSDVRVAEDGGIYVCSMAMNKGKTFNVYYWKDVDSTPVQVLEYTISDPAGNSTAVRLGDALSIIGDPSADGYIMSSNFPSGNTNQGQFYIWKFTAGKAAAEPEIVDLVGQYKGASDADKALGQYARINEIPGDSEHYICTGANVGMLVLSSDFSKVEFELVKDTPVQGRAQDPHFFEYNGVRYLTYTVNREWAANDAYMEVVALTEGDNYVDGLKALAEKSIDDISVYRKQITTAATSGAAWVSAGNNVKILDDKVYIFSYVCEYGAFVMEFSK